MFNEATFRDILLPSLSNVNDYVMHIQSAETIKLSDKTKLHNATN